MFNKIFFAAAVFASMAASAQAPVGVVLRVEGLVTVSDGVTVNSGVTGGAIPNGARFVTSSTGSVTLRMNNGCIVTLKPNQAVTVDRESTCEALVASIQPVGGVVVATARSGWHPLMALPFVVGAWDISRNLSNK